jgi:hypothetical protein
MLVETEEDCQDNWRVDKIIFHHSHMLCYHSGLEIWNEDDLQPFGTYTNGISNDSAIKIDHLNYWFQLAFENRFGEKLKGRTMEHCSPNLVSHYIRQTLTCEDPVLTHTVDFQDQSEVADDKNRIT